MSDVDGFLDEEAEAALRRRGAGRRNDVPRHVDSIGENLSRSFEGFLEKYFAHFQTNLDKG